MTIGSLVANAVLGVIVAYMKTRQESRAKAMMSRETQLNKIFDAWKDIITDLRNEVEKLQERIRELIEESVNERIEKGHLRIDIERFQTRIRELESDMSSLTKKK